MMRNPPTSQPRVAFYFCCTAVILILALLDGAAAQTIFTHGNDVAFSITTAQKSYEIGDKIVISYTVTNVSNGPVTVPRSAWDAECAQPHLWALLEESSGKHYEGGYAGSCTGWSGFQTRNLSDKVAQVAVRLEPGQSTAGSFPLDSGVFAKELKSGTYRLEAILYGWNSHYSDAELRDLSQMGAPLLAGETHASTQIELTAARR
jgi:hypothetical protein